MNVNCTVCRREFWEDELGRQACRPCEAVTARTLAAIPALFREASELASLMRGSASDNAGISSAAGSTAPLKIGVLSITAKGGAVTELQAVEDAWRNHLGWKMGATRHHADIDGVTSFLAANLPWAYENYPEIAQDHNTIKSLFGQLAASNGGEKRPRRIPVQCGCGTVLRITLDTPGARCPGCETQYGRAEVLRLPMAERSAA